MVASKAADKVARMHPGQRVRPWLQQTEHCSRTAAKAGRRLAAYCSWTSRKSSSSRFLNVARRSHLAQSASIRPRMQWQRSSAAALLRAYYIPSTDRLSRSGTLAVAIGLRWSPQCESSRIKSTSYAPPTVTTCEPTPTVQSSGAISFVLSRGLSTYNIGRDAKWSFTISQSCWPDLRHLRLHIYIQSGSESISLRVAQWCSG